MDIILKYFPNLSEQQKEQFAQLDELYRYWNERINTISRKDIDSLYEHHVLHSLSIAKLISFRDGTEVFDVGCGGGFPGIPLAIMFPNVKFHMVDSIGKKIKVVNEVATALGLTNIIAEHTRAENVKKQFDFVISRAVTAFPEFMGFIKNKVHHKDKNSLPNGLLYLKGGNFMSELSKYKKDATIVDITDFFEEDFFETKKIVYLQM
jgi:16S rRNA (guanine527-N7)-methyltransferase